jgi:glycosyltransferase involved in cell wall biosynthesis
MNSPQVSIILIGYNDSKRLPAALESLTDQSFREIEIIAVDDCSTDNSVEILRTAAQSDPRIRIEVLAENSGGCSAPRNRGMQLATAPFVMFCDSDDTYDRHAVRNLYIAINEMKTDVVVGAARRVISGTGEKKIWRPELHAQPEVFEGLNEQPGLLFDTISVNKIYRTEFLLANGIDFPSGLLFEDQLFTLKCYLAASRIGVIPEVVYNWNVERAAKEGSITQSRSELRNVRDRIAINELMDRALESNQVLAHYKNQKFLQHELSLYLATLLELSQDQSSEIIQILSEYIRSIPIEDFECLRPGLRVATYYLLLGDQEQMRRSLYWEKGGGFINTELVEGDRDLWSREDTELMGRSASWWLDVSELHLTLIPFDQRRYFATMEKGQDPDQWLITCVDFAGDLPADTAAQVILRETKTGALIAFRTTPTQTGASHRSFLVHLGSSSAELIQDRGIYSGERGSVQIQITCGLGVSRSDLHIKSGEDIPELSITRLASLGSANQIVFETRADLRIFWKAKRISMTLTGVVRKLRRMRNNTPNPSHLPLIKVLDRPTVVFAPADLNAFDSRLERFDTQAWIDDFGVNTYLLIPLEVFTPAPKRSQYAFGGYSPRQLKDALSIADIVITDRPELMSDPKAIIFRKDLGAARYLLPPFVGASIEDQRVLHELIRTLLPSQKVGE